VLPVASPCFSQHTLSKHMHTHSAAALLSRVPPAGSCVRVLTSQTSCVTCLGFSPDGQQLAAGTEDGTVAVYDLGSARRYVCKQ
jgi:WD40 repeat protein